MTAVQVAAKAGVPLSTIVREVEREAIIAALDECDWNRCRTAKHFGIHRNTLSRKMEILHIGVKSERRKAVAKAAWLAGARARLWQIA